MYSNSFDDAHIELLDEPERFRDFDKVPRHDYLAVIILDAQQDFMVHRLLICQPHDGLREEHQSFLVDRIAYLFCPVDALMGAAHAVRALVEQYVTIAPKLFRLIHRDIDIGQDRYVRAVEGIERDPN